MIYIFSFTIDFFQVLDTCCFAGHSKGNKTMQRYRNKVAVES